MTASARNTDGGEPGNKPSPWLAFALTGSLAALVTCLGAPRGCRKPQMQGRFSGRLALKEDERKLVDECRLVGPLLGGAGQRGDKAR